MRHDAVEHALAAIRQQGLVVLVDEPGRENEGDLVAAAEDVTPEQINMMLRYARGVLCLALPEYQLQQLDLPLLPQRGEALHPCAFTLSFDAAQGIHTGVSAADRAHSIRVAVSETVQPQDIVTPGHIFPCQAHAGGLAARQGHTEASVALVDAAGMLRPGAVMCEIVGDDGTMLRGEGLEAFSKRWDLPLLYISELVRNDSWGS